MVVVRLKGSETPNTAVYRESLPYVLRRLQFRSFHPRKDYTIQWTVGVMNSPQSQLKVNILGHTVRVTTTCRRLSLSMVFPKNKLNGSAHPIEPSISSAGTPWPYHLSSSTLLVVCLHPLVRVPPVNRWSLRDVLSTKVRCRQADKSMGCVYW